MKLNIKKSSSDSKKISLGGVKDNSRFDSLIFSSYSFKSKYIDISIDCVEYDDESFSYPLDSLFDIAKSKRYNNAVFVLDRNIFNESEISYTPVYTILTEKCISGFECDTIEILDLFPFKSFEDAKPRLPEIIANNLATNKTMAQPLSVGGYRVDDFYCNNGVNINNPFKRNILLLFEKRTGISGDKDIARKTALSIVSLFSKDIKDILSTLIDNYYIEYLSFIAVDKIKQVKFTEEYYKPDNSSYLKMAEAELNKIKFSYIQLPEPINGIVELKSPVNMKTFAPDGKDKDSFLNSKSIDALITYLYVEPISIESYFGKQKKNSALMFSKRKRELDSIKANESEILNIKSFSKERLKKICEENDIYILLTYKTSDISQRKMFMYPDKVFTNEEFLKIKNKRDEELSKDRLSDQEAQIKEFNRIESLARLEPKNDDEVLEKMMAFSKYDEMAQKVAAECGFNEVNNESFFSKLYGKSFYELCMGSTTR